MEGGVEEAEVGRQCPASSEIWLCILLVDPLRDRGSSLRVTHGLCSLGVRLSMQQETWLFKILSPIVRAMSPSLGGPSFTSLL